MRSYFCDMLHFTIYLQAIDISDMKAGRESAVLSMKQLAKA